MLSLRKLMNKPRPDDWSPLAKFFYADEQLNDIASELDSFDGRRDPERCNVLVTKLRVAQDRVLHIISEMLVILYPRESDRANRDFRIKFPEEIIHDSLPGQLWFGAECLAAGSNIIEHEYESDCIRPLARDLTRQLDSLRDMLKDQSLRDPSVYTDAIKENILKFDHLFAEFEFSYVSAMVPVKSIMEHDAQQDVAVLYSEVLEMALQRELLTQDQIDYCDPIVMIVVPRLAIVWGLLYFSEGALCVEKSEKMSQMFRPNLTLLIKIRNLLRILIPKELLRLENVLCSGDGEEIVDEEEVLTMKEFRKRINEPGQQPVSRLRPARSRQSRHANYRRQPSRLAIAPWPAPRSVAAIETQAPPTAEAAERAASSSGPISHRELEGVEAEVVSMMSDPEMAIVESEDEQQRELLEQIDQMDQMQRDYDNSLSDTEHLFHNDYEGSTRVTPSDPEQLRNRFRSSDDLVHRLFVCIAGIADQLQTTHSTDIRKVLKLILQPSEIIPVYEVNGTQAATNANEEEVGVEVQESLPLPSFIGVRWVPDSDCEQCTSCSSNFTVVRRRHHCRNCGRIFCHRCSAHSICIPELGYERKVRVCNLCYLHRMNPFAPCTGEPSADMANEEQTHAPSSTPVENDGDEDDTVVVPSPPPAGEGETEMMSISQPSMVAIETQQ